MVETLPSCLLRLSEAGGQAILPGRQAARYFGREFDRLLARRVLVELAPAESWSACSTCECDVGERPIQVVSGQLVAACSLDATQDLLLDPEDIRCFEIDRTKLVEEISRASGFVGKLVELMSDVWQLPAHRRDPVTLVSSDRAAREPSFIPMLSLRLSAQRGIVLLPNYAPADLGYRLADAGFGGVKTIEVVRNDWSIDLSALLGGSKMSSRLVIRRSAKEAELDRRALSLADQPFRLLLILAQAAQNETRFIDHRIIEKKLWEGLQLPKSRELRDIVRELRDGLAGSAQEPVAARALVQNKRSPVSSWGLLLEPGEIAVTE